MKRVVHVGMNNDIFAGKWTEAKGEIKKKWAELTDNDLDATKGNFQSLVGVLQQKLGFAKDDAHKSLSELAAKWTNQTPTGQGLASRANEAIDSAKDKLKKTGTDSY